MDSVRAPSVRRNISVGISRSLPDLNTSTCLEIRRSIDIHATPWGGARSYQFQEAPAATRGSWTSITLQQSMSCPSNLPRARRRQCPYNWLAHLAYGRVFDQPLPLRPSILVAWPVHVQQ